MRSEPDDSAPGPDGPPVVLLTRPQAASERVARALARQAGPHRALIAPILEIRLLPLSVSIDSRSVLVLSSAHAVAALQKAGAVAGQRAFCVGDATAEAARAAGLDARSAQGDAEALAALVTREAPPGPICWLHGAHTRGKLVKTLEESGFDISESVVYEQRETALTGDARKALAGSVRVILPVYSPRSAVLLGRACAGATAPLDAVFISAAARDGWSGPPLGSVSVADHPDGPSMLDAVSRRVAADPLA